MKPVRVQRRRLPGWRTPLCGCGCGLKAIYVGRGTRWGNPFRTGRSGRVEFDIGGGRTFSVEHGKLTRETAVSWFRDLVTDGWESFLFGTLTQELDVEPLRGHDLSCWCPPDAACHADALLELANTD